MLIYVLLFVFAGLVVHVRELSFEWVVLPPAITLIVGNGIHLALQTGGSPDAVLIGSMAGLLAGVMALLMLFTTTSGRPEPTA